MKMRLSLDVDLDVCIYFPYNQLMKKHCKVYHITGLLSALKNPM